MAVFVFLSWLAAGMLLALALVKLGPEGREFFLFNGALVLALGGTAYALRILGPRLWGAGAAVGLSTPAAWASGLALGVVATYLLLAAAGAREARSLLKPGAFLALLGILADSSALHATAPARVPGSAWLHLLNALSSAWLAGSILLAMILGHFYLVIPRLGIEPLRGLFRLALLGLGLRVLLVGAVGLMWWAQGQPPLGVGSLLHTGVFVLQRVLFGLLIPVSLAWFTWKTIEMRSTQSATGILYVVVFLTLVGEALSVYLSLDTAVPI